MEDFKIWIYLVFGAIYLITRVMKKKKPEEAPHSPLETADDNYPKRQAPSSFEELLQEFTEQREEKEEPAIREEAVKSSPVEVDTRLEGERRHFADEESRQIYERSIQEAEGADISYERDEHFKVNRAASEHERSHEIGSSLKSMLRNPGSARKAVILAEILNRKY